MKKFLLTIMVISIATAAYAYCHTDPFCLSDCLDKEYPYDLCKKQCTYCK